MFDQAKLAVVAYAVVSGSATDGGSSTRTNSGITTPPGDMGASTATSFEVEALRGPAFRLTLYGRALPYQGFKLTGKLKVETTFYPGNPVATQQVIGSEEGSTAQPRFSVPRISWRGPSTPSHVSLPHALPCSPSCTSGGSRREPRAKRGGAPRRGRATEGFTVMTLQKQPSLRQLTRFSLAPSP